MMRACCSKNVRWLAVSLIMLGVGLWSSPGAADDKVDWNRALELVKKFTRDGKLPPEEMKFLESARAVRLKEADRYRELTEKQRRGDKLAPQDKLFLDAAIAIYQAPPFAGKEKWGLQPLTEMTGTYKGETGGLYGDGHNEPPEAHRKAADREMSKIEPLDADGKPAADGKVVMISLGVSNTSGQFQFFMRRASKLPDRSPHLVLVNGAVASQVASFWADPDTHAKRTWENLEAQLKAAKVTSKQVQVAWLKILQGSPASHGEFPKHARKLQQWWTTTLNILKERYPNVRLAFLSARIYGGYCDTPFLPEPYSYEYGFAVRWLIQDQIKGDPRLNCDPALGPVKAPLLLWGPYFWADGLAPRKSDGLVWERKDFSNDGVHPSLGGYDKIGGLMVNFFRTNEHSRPWFLKSAKK